MISISLFLFHLCLCYCQHFSIYDFSSFRNVPFGVPQGFVYRHSVPIRQFDEFTSRSSGSDLAFPGSLPVQEPNTVPNVNEPVNLINGNDKCLVRRGMIHFQNKCHQIFSTGPCPFGFWVILDQDGRPNCDTRPCAEGKLLHNNQCVDSEDHTVCNLNEILYLEFDGYTSCDCEPSAVYDTAREICVYEYTQDFCPPGQYIESDGNGNMICVANPCQSDKYTLNPTNGRCYVKDFLGRCNANNVQIHFDEKESTAGCQDINTRRILQVPISRACPSGSRRDHLNNCRRLVNIQSSRNPFNYRVPSRVFRSGTLSCPRGYRRYPNGSCQKANSYFLG